jgi:hypothetical protein
MKNIIILFVILLVSCNQTKSKINKKCVIDNVEIKQSISTIEPEPIYLYYTNCGNTIKTKSKYHVGDTITIEFKK